MKARRAVAGLLAILLVNAGCGAAPEATPTAGQTAEPTGPGPAATSTSPPTVTAAAASSTPGATVGQSGEISGEGEVTLGSGTLDFPDPVAGLSTLASHVATLQLAFSGTRDGQPSEWSTTYAVVAVADPAAHRLTIEPTGDAVDTARVLMAEVGGVAYEQRDGDACIGQVIEAGQTLANDWEPAGHLTGVLGATGAGNETVNGRAANKYTFDEAALGQGGATESDGALWVATDGGYLVKYALTSAAGSEYFGPGVAGTMHWAYDLTDVNQPFAITLPADCPPGLLDADLLPDASAVVNEPGTVSYVTSSTTADVLAFYQEDLPPLGWAIEGESVASDTLALQDYTREGQRLTLIVTAGDGQTTVLLSAGPIAH